MNVQRFLLKPGDGVRFHGNTGGVFVDVTYLRMTTDREVVTADFSATRHAEDRRGEFGSFTLSPADDLTLTLEGYTIAIAKIDRYQPNSGNLASIITTAFNRVVPLRHACEVTP